LRREHHALNRARFLKLFFAEFLDTEFQERHRHFVNVRKQKFTEEGGSAAEASLAKRDVSG
jgi:hypothetical protein